MKVAVHSSKYAHDDCRYNANPGPVFSSTLTWVAINTDRPNRAERRRDLRSKFRIASPRGLPLAPKRKTIRRWYAKFLALDEARQAEAERGKKKGLLSFLRGNRPQKPERTKTGKQSRLVGSR